MTNAERRERRREAARKGLETRRAKLAAEPPRPESAEEERLTNLRAVLRLAQEGRRETDLYYHAHLRRWHHSPRRWTAEQIAEARRFLEGFRDETGRWSFQRSRRKPWL